MQETYTLSDKYLLSINIKNYIDNRRNTKSQIYTENIQDRKFTQKIYKIANLHRKHTKSQIYRENIQNRKFTLKTYKIEDLH